MTREANTCFVTDDLSSITSYVPDQETDPVRVGMAPGSTDAIWKAVQRLYRTDYHPTTILCVRRHGHIILNRAIGHARGNGPNDDHGVSKVLATPDTPVCLFSASKAVTAMMIHLIAERGLIRLEDRVSKYVPEFSSHGKDRITIEQVLCHRAGFPFIPMGTPPELMFNEDMTLELMYHIKPKWAAGKRQAYHAITGGFILAEVLKRVTGQDIRTFFRETVQEPLGMKYFNYGATDEHIPRIAQHYPVGKPLRFPVNKILSRALGETLEEVTRVSNDPRFYQAVIPAGNMVATAEEISRFYQAMLNGGEVDGVRLFSPETVRRATENVGGFEMDYTMMLPLRYTRGMMTGNNPVGLFGPNSVQAYGHLGFMTVLTWADPARQTSVALLTTGKTIFGTHIMPLIGLMSTINRECAPV